MRRGHTTSFREQPLFYRKQPSVLTPSTETVFTVCCAQIKCIYVTSWVVNLACPFAGLRVHQKSNNETVQTYSIVSIQIVKAVNSITSHTQDFGENENQNHADEKTRLLSTSTDTGVTNNTNSETSSETSETDSETSTELNETGVQAELLLETIGNQDRNDEAVDTNDTSHDNGDNV